MELTVMILVKTKAENQFNGQTNFNETDVKLPDFITHLKH